MATLVCCREHSAAEWTTSHNKLTQHVRDTLVIINTYYSLLGVTMNELIKRFLIITITTYTLVCISAV